MEIISYTEVRIKLAELMDRVNVGHRPVIITRRQGTPAVLISLDDFNGYVETDYLLSSPQNATRLAKAMQDLKMGAGRTRKLIWPLNPTGISEQETD